MNNEELKKAGAPSPVAVLSLAGRGGRTKGTSLEGERKARKQSNELKKRELLQRLAIREFSSDADTGGWVRCWGGGGWGVVVFGGFWFFFWLGCVGGGGGFLGVGLFLFGLKEKKNV